MTRVMVGTLSRKSLAILSNWEEILDAQYATTRRLGLLTTYVLK